MDNGGDARATERSGGWSSVFDRMADATSIHAVFGEPIVRDDRTIIPMANVFSVLGLGGGDTPTTSRSGGGGGGGFIHVAPVGIVELNSDGVHVHSSPNVNARIGTIIALVVAWNIFWILDTVRNVKAGQADATDRA